MSAVERGADLIPVQEEVREAVVGLTRVAAAVEAGRLGLLRASAGLDDGSGPGPGDRQRMVSTLRVSPGRARADLDNAVGHVSLDRPARPRPGHV